MRRLALIPLLLACPAGAAPALELSGSFRTRAEAIDGQLRPGFASAELLLVSRLILRAELGDGPVRLVGELWDSRAWGAAERSVVSTNEVNALEPVQAYLEMRPADAVRLVAGRQMVNLGARRLIAADDFRNTTNGYTGVLAELGGGTRPGLQLFALLPQERLPDEPDRVRRNAAGLDRESFDLWIAGGVATLPGLPQEVTAQATLVRLEEQDGRRPTPDRRLTTAALRLWRAPAPGAFDFDVEGFVQGGRIRASVAAAAPDLQVEAYALHAAAGMSLAGRWKPRVALEYDLATGDRPGGRYGRFDTLFGMRRAEIAPSGLYNSVGRANLSAPGVRLEVQPGPATDAFVTAKWLWAEAGQDSFSTSGVRDPTGRAGREAGQQLDLRVRHRIAKERLRLEGNMLVLRRDGVLAAAPNAPGPGTTLYGALSLTGVF